MYSRLLVAGIVSALSIVLAGEMVAYTFTTINEPSAGAGGTYAAAINDARQVTGRYYDGTDYHGFVDTNGIFTTSNYPGETIGNSMGIGINDAGQVVGTSQINGVAYGFVDPNGSLSTIDYPGATTSSTSVGDINNVWPIVGVYTDGTGTHGLVAPPTSLPKPASLVVLGTVLLGLGRITRRMRPLNGKPSNKHIGLRPI